MPKLGVRTITGSSGNDYEFNVYPGKMVFNDFIPGIFAICKDEDVIYLGESDHVDRALTQHEKKDDFAKAGFNQICFHRIANPSKRRAAYDDLLKTVKPEIS